MSLLPWGAERERGSIRETSLPHSRDNVTLHQTLHLVTDSSQPYMVMSITRVVVYVKHSRKINRGSPAAPETKMGL